MTLNLELQKSECPTGRELKSCRETRIGGRWCHNDVPLDWEVHYCSGFAPRMSGSPGRSPGPSDKIRHEIMATFFGASVLRAGTRDNFFGKVLTVYFVLCTVFFCFRPRSSENHSLEVGETSLKRGA